MHWTVLTMIGLCLACLVLNVVQWRMVGGVRGFGIAVCAAWALQEAVWWEMRADSIILIYACDITILWLAWRRRPLLDITDRMIVAAILPTMACVLFAKLNGGATPASYWLNWSIVLAQMVLGLPRPKWQWGLKEFSHGPLRPAERNSGGI